MHRRLAIASLALLCCVTWPFLGHADEYGEPPGEVGARDFIKKPFLKKVGKRALKRVRRSLTFGPYVGVAPAFGLENGGEFAFDFEFGLALMRYSIPIIPTPERVKEILMGKMKSILKQRIKAAIARGEAPSESLIEQWRQEVLQALKDEFLLKVNPKKFEKPSLLARATIDRLFGEDAWNLRVAFGLGIGPVFFTGGLGFTANSPVAGLASLELSVPILISDGLRSPVVEPFVRLDASTGEDDGRSDHLLFGARFVLDII